jgi:dienelactone hydrolase
LAQGKFVTNIPAGDNYTQDRDKEKFVKVLRAGFNMLVLVCLAIFLFFCAHNAPLVANNKPKDPNAVLFQSSATTNRETSLNLTGQIRKPEGDGPFPAVVLLHGCGGINPKRDIRWIERLSNLGYVTLQVDSFGPRGISNACTYSGKDFTEILQKRVTDAYDAKRYLAGLPFVDRSRIAVIGWSQGGLTTLQALYKDKEEPFRVAVAFYPSCIRPLTNMNAPLLILIGDADDWTPASKCVSMMPKEKTSPEVILKVYPGAYHGFDMLGSNLNVKGSKGLHHLQYQPEAEKDSLIQVKDFLEKYMR